MPDDPDATEVPAILQKRLAEARARIAARTAPPPQPTRASLPPMPRQTAPKAKPAKAPKPASKDAKGRAARDRAAEPTAPALEGRDALIVATLRARATDQAMMALMTDEELLALWAGMREAGRSKMPGSAGDRAALFSALGLPFYQTRKTGAGAADRPAGSIAGRMERALARVQAPRRLDPVTGDDDGGDEPTADAA